MSPNNLAEPYTTTLEGHRDAVNVVRFNTDLTMLVSGDESGLVIVWDLTTRGPLQLIDVASAGPVKAICWLNLHRDEEERGVLGLALGFGTGTIEIYRQSSENQIFEFIKTTDAHGGPIENLEFDGYSSRLASTGGGYPQVWSLKSMQLLKRVSPEATGFLPYICRGAHFTDRGDSLIVTYIESHTVMKYTVDPWELKSTRTIQARIGYSAIDGDNLFTYNLKDGIDVYSLRTMQRTMHYAHIPTINAPLQIALARQNRDWVVMGGMDGIVRVYDRVTSELVHQLEHAKKGRVQVVDASSTHEIEIIAAASTTCKQRSTIQLWYLKEPSNTAQSSNGSSRHTQVRFIHWSSWLLRLLGIVVLQVLVIYGFLLSYRLGGAKVVALIESLVAHNSSNLIPTQTHTTLITSTQPTSIMSTISSNALTTPSLSTALPSASPSSPMLACAAGTDLILDA